MSDAQASGHAACLEPSPTPVGTGYALSPTAPATSQPPATKRRCSSAAASTAAENCTGSSMRCPKLETRPYWLRMFRRACLSCAVNATGTEGARAHSMQLAPLLLQLLPLPPLKLHNAELWAPARGGAVTAAGWALLLKPMPPLPLQHDAESWHAGGGAVAAAGGCTKEAQSVMIAPGGVPLLQLLPPPSLPQLPPPSPPPPQGRGAVATRCGGGQTSAPGTWAWAGGRTVPVPG